MARRVYQTSQSSHRLRGANYWLASSVVCTAGQKMVCGWHGRSPVDHCSASEDKLAAGAHWQAFRRHLQRCPVVVHSESSKAKSTQTTQTIRDCSSAVVLSAQKVGLQNPTERIPTTCHLKPARVPPSAPSVPPSTPNQQPPKPPRRGILRHSLTSSPSPRSCPLRLQPFLAWSSRMPAPSVPATALRCNAMQEHRQGSGMTLSFTNEISFFLRLNKTPKRSHPSVLRLSASVCVCLRLSAKLTDTPYVTTPFFPLLRASTPQLPSRCLLVASLDGTTISVDLATFDNLAKCPLGTLTGSSSKPLSSVALALQ